MAPVRCVLTHETPEVNTVFNLSPLHPLYTTGQIIAFRWNRTYIFQDEAGHAELIRVVDCNPGNDPIDDGEPPLLHHGGTPTFNHTGHIGTDCSTALARLKMNPLKLGAFARAQIQGAGAVGGDTLSQMRGLLAEPEARKSV